MKRREFLHRWARLSASVPFFSLVHGCADDGRRYDDFEIGFDGQVTIVGAGPAGLAAGYLLQRYDIDFQILEASSDFGGRVRRVTDFVDFPIDLGAEWIHDDPSILAALLDDPTVDGSIDVVPYSPESASVWSDGQLQSHNYAMNYYGEYKFKRTTWYGFLEQYIVPSILERISFERPVTSIDYSGPRIQVTDSLGTAYETDRVLLAVPLQLLRQPAIAFTPGLPADKLEIARTATIPPGIKVFLEFSERFYPDIVLVGSLLGDDVADRIFYDAAFRKDSPRHVLALFNVGEGAAEYTDLEDDDAVIAQVLGELDTMFDGQASQYFLRAVVQNWVREPYIQGAYVTDYPGSTEDFVDALRAPVDGRIFFAGGGMSAEDLSTVHGAMQCAYEVVEVLLRG